MKVLTYYEHGKYIPAVLTDLGVVSFKKAGFACDSVLDFIKSGKTSVLEKAVQGVQGVPLESVDLCAPIPFPDDDIICLGINFMEHAEESTRFKKEVFEREPEYPVYFAKRLSKAMGSGEDIGLHSDITDSVDYEAEIALIIGKDATNVKREDAYDYVFGYTVLNDISARDLQTRHRQWYFGKSLDGFTAMGPYIVTSDEIGNVEDLYIRSYVNGELRQNGNTGKLIFNIPHVIEELSRGITLTAGTVISMGTPAGVGMGLIPPVYLKDGDEVICEVQNIGQLKNKFVK